MTLLGCGRDAEVKLAVARGHWPHSCAPELPAHVESCAACRDVAMVTAAMLGARAVSLVQAQLPPAGVVWWRAQLRRRKEAVERISRPIWMAQVFALSVCLTMVAGLMVWQGAHWYEGIGQWLKGLQHPSMTLLELWSTLECFLFSIPIL
jgi:hypothetical protein